MPDAAVTACKLSAVISPRRLEIECGGYKGGEGQRAPVCLDPTRKHGAKNRQTFSCTQDLFKEKEEKKNPAEQLTGSPRPRHGDILLLKDGEKRYPLSVLQDAANYI